MSDEYRIILSKRAANDLERIFKHISDESPQNAPKYIDQILDDIARLAIFPHRNVVEGQSPRAKHPVRSLPVASHIVFFRVFEDSNVVRIVQVRHGARRHLKRFRRR